MPSKSRKSDLDSGFGLSFLDILCCGLGAVILLLLIVRHGQKPVEVVAPDISQVKVVQQMRAAISKARDTLEDLSQENADLQALAQDERNRLLATQKSAGASQAMKDILEVIRKKAIQDAKRKQMRAEFSAIDRKRKETPPPKPTSQKRRISGAVEGIDVSDTDRVVILVDISASMVHRSLIQIIRLMNSSDKAQKNAVKWRQSMGAATWAHDSVSPHMRYKMLFFSESVYDLEGAKVDKLKLSWDKKTASDDIKFVESLSRLTPKGGTNLDRALKAVSTLVPNPKRVLIITDGLPNRIDVSGARNRLSRQGCTAKSFDPAGTTSTDCRLSIGIASVMGNASRLSRVPIDVVLLPLDGDSTAVWFYSLVTSAANGRLLTPSQDWLIN